MLNTIGSTESAANPKKIEGEAGGNSVVGNSMADGGEVIN